MTKQITPPPELVREWARGCSPYDVPADHIATHAARWGADQELEACCSEIDNWGDIHNSDGWELSQDLRTARRPKPPTLKEQALKALDSFEGFTGSLEEVDTIRRALEALPDD